MHDPTSLFRFEEHDIYLPILTLEELDANKKGMTEVARNARQASRFLDELVTTYAAPGSEGIAKAFRSTRSRAARRPAGCSCRPKRSRPQLPPSLAHGKADNQIIAVVMHLTRQSTEAQRDPGVEGHQHADQGARARPRRRGLLQRQGARGHRAPLLGRARAAGRLLGPPRQGHGVVAAGRPHVLPPDRPARPVAARERVPVPGAAGRGAVLRDRQGDPGQDRAAVDAQGLHAPEEQRVGHHRAQPRAELRAQPADESGDRLRHAARARRAPARRCSRSPPASC